VIYREFFPRGLTALDEVDESAFGLKAKSSHAIAREEIKGLIEGLKLPVDERGKRRAAARAEWAATEGKPLDTHELLA
jgi:chromosome partitioning protein